MSDQSTFDAAYWSHQHPEVAALRDVQDFDSRAAQAMSLAAQGAIIDVPIMVWQWDPYLVMKYRLDLGYSWVPSALQPPLNIAPGIVQPGTPPYDPTHPPVGSIKVSINPADYPPFAPAPPPVAITQLVGAQIISGINQYFAVLGDHSPAGTTFTDSRGEFVKYGVPVQGPFGVQGGLTYYWKLTT